MNLQKPAGIKLYCFSPPVMLATFGVEILLAVYVTLRYKLNSLGRLAVTMLVALGVFQACEYFVCGGWGVGSESWSRLGYVCITLLPPLGLHMLHLVSGKKDRRLVMISYATMVGFAGYFLLAPGVFKSYQCTGNYVIFQTSMRATLVYALYYFGWIAVGVGKGIAWASDIKRGTKAMNKKAQAIIGLVVGYLVFLVPTTVANVVNPKTRAGIPSIMCGFAVIFAVILTMYILPRVGERRRIA